MQYDSNCFILLLKQMQRIFFQMANRPNCVGVELPFQQYCLSSSSFQASKLDVILIYSRLHALPVIRRSIKGLLLGFVLLLLESSGLFICISLHHHN